MQYRSLILGLIAFTVAMPVSAPRGIAGGIVLPDLGSGGISMIAGTREKHIGRSILNELRRNNLVLEDPELNEYVQNLGSRLAAAGGSGKTDFKFFIIKEDSVNAFALPGGYIGIHSGLFLRTESESELASVLAHEVAHVTQRHISRRFDAGSGLDFKSLAVLLGAVALAASGADADDVSGALMLGQGLVLQERINFTRAQEYEADRVGVGILARAGFDPEGMVNFFETMQRMQRLRNSRMPEFLSTHPLSLSRVTEAAQRVRAMGDIETVRESRAYPLMKARLGVLASNASVLHGNDNGSDASARYARALALLEDGEADSAAALFRDLLAGDDSITHYHIGLGNALMKSGKTDEALAILEQAKKLFPGNIPVILARANALRQTGQAEQALELLRDLFNRQPAEPAHIRTLAHTAADAGEIAESHYYMAEYYLQLGDLNSGRLQLKIALESAEPESNEYLQYKARLEEVSDALQEQRRNEPRNQVASRPLR